MKKLLLYAFIAAIGFFAAGCTEKSGTDGAAAEKTSQSHYNKFDSADADVPVVDMFKNITPENLIAIYKQLGRPVSGKVAVKIHTGEPGGNNYLKPALIKDFVQSINGTIVECCTAYDGRRATPASHYQVAVEHGFTAIAPVDILDTTGSIQLPITNGKHLKYDIVGSRFSNYDFLVVLSHFKGHTMGGFGGAIKNMSIGIASASGKAYIHSAGKSTTNAWVGTAQDDFLESMAEAAKAVADAKGEKILYINIMNNLSVDCDCDSSPAAPEMDDIGILASLDPVALDRACVDLVYAAPADKSKSLRQRIESRNGTHMLDYAAQIGLGKLAYKLVVLGESGVKDR